MRTVELGGVSVNVDTVATIEWGVSERFFEALDDHQAYAFLRQHADAYKSHADILRSIREPEDRTDFYLPYPNEDDYRVVVVTLVNGREFEVEDKTKEEVREMIYGDTQD